MFHDLQPTSWTPFPPTAYLLAYRGLARVGSLPPTAHQVAGASRRRRRPLELPRAGPRFRSPALSRASKVDSALSPELVHAPLALRTTPSPETARHAVLELVLSGDGASRPASGTTPSLRFVRAAPSRIYSCGTSPSHFSPHPNASEKRTVLSSRYGSSLHPSSPNRGIDPSNPARRRGISGAIIDTRQAWRSLGPACTSTTTSSVRLTLPYFTDY